MSDNWDDRLWAIVGGEINWDEGFNQLGRENLGSEGVGGDHDIFGDLQPEPQEQNQFPWNAQLPHSSNYTSDMTAGFVPFASVYPISPPTHAEQSTAEGGVEEFQYEDGANEVMSSTGSSTGVDAAGSAVVLDSTISANTTYEGTLQPSQPQTNGERGVTMMEISRPPLKKRKASGPSDDERDSLSREPTPSASDGRPLRQCCEGCYHCPLDSCDVSKRSRKDMQYHLLTHNPPKKCRHCDKSFPKTAELERHEKSMHKQDVKGWYCTWPNCKRSKGSGRPFRRDNARNHIKGVHGKQEWPADSIGGRPDDEPVFFEGFRRIRRGE